MNNDAQTKNGACCRLGRLLGTESLLQKKLATPLGFAFFWGGGALLLLAERLLTLYYLPEKLPFYYAVTAWTMDLFWPLLLFSLALKFRQALIAGASYLLLLFMLLFHALNLVMLSRTIHVMDAAMGALLWENCGKVPFQVYFGEYYVLLFIAFAVLLLGLLFGAAASFRYCYAPLVGSKAIRRLSRFGICGLLICGISSMLVYLYVRNNVLFKGWFPREWGARPVQQYMVDFAKALRYKRPQPTTERGEGFFPEKAPREAVLDQLRDLGITGQGAIQFPDTVLPVVPNPQYDKILLIVLESIDQAFLLPDMPPGLTPFLSSFYHRNPTLNAGFHCFVLPDFYCSAQPTCEGINALLSSRLDYFADLHFRNPSLLSVLKDHGYATKMLCGVSGDFHNQKNEFMQIFSPGETLFLEELFAKHRIKGNGYWGADDPSLYKAALKVLMEEKNPRQCVVLSTIDTHPPYRASEWKGKDYENPFLNSLAAADHNLKAFLDALARSPWWDDRTLVILTSDHTATHGENYRRRTEFIPERIPLIFLEKKPLLLQRLNQGKVCCSLDLAPTILNLLGIPAPRTFMGRSLIGDGPVSRAVSLYDRNELLYRDAKGKLHRFRLDAPVTPQEKALTVWYRTFYGD